MPAIVRPLLPAIGPEIVNEPECRTPSATPKSIGAEMVPPPKSPPLLTVRVDGPLSVPAVMVRLLTVAGVATVALVESLRFDVLTPDGTVLTNSVLASRRIYPAASTVTG